MRNLILMMTGKELIFVAFLKKVLKLIKTNIQRITQILNHQLNSTSIELVHEYENLYFSEDPFEADVRYNPITRTDMDDAFHDLLIVVESDVDIEPDILEESITEEGNSRIEAFKSIFKFKSNMHRFIEEISVLDQ